ncbi:MAG: cell division ATP-binding protein FtsE [Saprospiraceae bacterium]
MLHQTVVELQDVFIYQQQQLILKNVQLKLEKGEFVYLIGKTGSGKTSLLKSIYADLPFEKGKAVVAGFDLKNIDRKTIPLLRRKLGIVFQDFNLLSDRSVEENLLFVLRATEWKGKAKMQQRVNEVLTQVGLAQQSHRMPHTLSGGEKQRVVLARALLNQPELIIADEATGNLDPTTSSEILALIREIALANGTAVLFATHDYRMIAQFPARVVQCVAGELVEEKNFQV